MNAAGRAYVREAAAYLGLAAQLLVRRSILLPAIVLLLALIATNIVALLSQPLEGSSLPVPFVAAAIIRIAAILLVSVAVLRLATGSARSAWMPDAALWLYALLFTVSLSVPALTEILLGDITALRTVLIGNGVAALLVAPFSAWIAAGAVERPLAWRPADWLRRFGQWLPYRIVWALLLLVPLAALHSRLALTLLHGLGAWFWAIAIADGILGFLIVMIRLGLDAAAYRRVAQG